MNTCDICSAETHREVDEKGRKFCGDCAAPTTLVLAEKALVEKHVFNSAANETLAKSSQICEQRAGEYLDSWALENQQSVYLDIIARELGLMLTKEQKRLVVMASLCDIKLSRMTGPFKEDNHVDLNNYNSAFCSLLQWYRAKSPEPNK